MIPLYVTLVALFVFVLLPAGVLFGAVVLRGKEPPEPKYGPGPHNTSRLPVTHDGPPLSPLIRGPEHGTARTDLAAYAALLLCMALVGAAIWAASGWWG